MNAREIWKPRHINGLDNKLAGVKNSETQEPTAGAWLFVLHSKQLRACISGLRFSLKRNFTTSS